MSKIAQAIVAPMRRDPSLRWVLLLAAAALVVRLWGAWSNLPDVPNPDEFKTIWPPIRMAYGNWHASGGYPPLYMFVLLFEYAAYYGIGALLGHFSGVADFARQVIGDPTPLYLMGRTTSVLLGTVTVVVLYAVGRRLYDRRVGLLAAAFLAFDTVHVYQSHVVKPDVLMLFLAVASFWFVCGILQDGRARYYVLAGLLAGLATAAKYNAAVCVLAIAAAHLLRNRAQHASLARALASRLLWLSALCVVAGFLIGYPHIVLDPSLAWEAARTNSVDFFWAWLGWEQVAKGWIYYPVIALNTAWGLPLQVLALMGAADAVRRHRPADLLLLVLPAANYLAMGPVQVNQPRYFLLAMPCLLVLAARMLIGAWERVRAALPGRLQAAALGAAIVVLLAWPAGMSVFHGYLLSQPDPRVTARRWVEATIPDGSRIVLDQGGPQLAASAESLLALKGPPRGRFEEVEREVAATKHPAYWLLPVQHFISGQPYLEAREATVQPIEWYRGQGYEYVILSTLVYDAYLYAPGVSGRYPATMAFYDRVAWEGELLAEFSPLVTNPADFTSTDINPVPTIRVYRLLPDGETR